MANLMLGENITGGNGALQLDGGKLLVKADLTIGDIEIGAVEIKDGSSDTRAAVGANGIAADVKAIAAGTNVIGKVGVDQTTDGTTNKVQSHINVASAAVTAANPIPVMSVGFKSSSTSTRPDNATPYSIGDVVGTDAATNLSFSSIGGIAGGHFIITGVELEVDVAAIPNGFGNFRLHLYDAAPTAITDNLAFNLPSADRAKHIGYIDINFASNNDLGDTLKVNIDNINFKRKLAAASTTIYGMLQTQTAYTPTNSAVKIITLHGIQV